MLEIVGVSPVLFARKPKSIRRLASSFCLDFFALESHLCDQRLSSTSTSHLPALHLLIDYGYLVLILMSKLLKNSNLSIV